MISCEHWTACGAVNGGCCAIGVFKGTGSLGVCLSCEQYTGTEPQREADRKRINKKSRGRDRAIAREAEESWPDGPGTELKKLLKFFGITVAPGCMCNRRAQHMNRMGCQWCRDNIETIVGWLQEEAEKHKMAALARPAVLRRIIHTAIRRAAKKERLKNAQADVDTETPAGAG